MRSVHVSFQFALFTTRLHDLSARKFVKRFCFLTFEKMTKTHSNSRTSNNAYSTPLSSVYFSLFSCPYLHYLTTDSPRRDHDHRQNHHQPRLPLTEHRRSIRILVRLQDLPANSPCFGASCNRSI